MNNIFLGHLPIELKLLSDHVEIIPRYFPYDDDYFSKKYYNNYKLYICLEYEHPRYRFIKHPRRTLSGSFNKDINHLKQYQLRYHTKFIGKFFSEITSNNFNQSYSIPLGDIYKLINKFQGYKFKIRATYRISYNSYIYKVNFHSSRNTGRIQSYNFSRTNIFSNEIELTLPYDIRRRNTND